MSGGPIATRAALLAALLATAACRQIVGIQDPPPPACANPLIIDDIEDGDGSICGTAGRNGAWFTVGDGTPSAEVTPPDGASFQPEFWVRVPLRSTTTATPCTPS